MNCKDARDGIDRALISTPFSLPAEVDAHIENCPDCSAYLKEVYALQTVLNKHSLEVMPGELDNLTFEKIVSRAEEKKKKPVAWRPAFRWRWVLAPASVAAIFIIALLIRGNDVTTMADLNNTVSYSMTSAEIVDQIAGSDSLGEELLVTLANKNSDFEHVADELLSGSDINDLLSGLTDDELKALYNKIDKLKG